jgi:hypothetical protein
MQRLKTTVKVTESVRFSAAGTNEFKSQCGECSTAMPAPLVWNTDDLNFYLIFGTY